MCHPYRTPLHARVTIHGAYHSMRIIIRHADRDIMHISGMHQVRALLSPGIDISARTSEFECVSRCFGAKLGKI